MRSMELLRLLSLAALAAWVGGLVALGVVVAPGLFAILELRDPIAGRELAALLFGEIFKRFQYLGLAAGGVALASLGLRAALGPRPRRTAVRIWTTLAMVAVCVVTLFFIAPAIDHIREQTAGPIAGLPPTDPTRILFGRLHGASTALMVVAIVAGLGLIWFEARDRH